eukprot:gene19780-25719_t
MFETFTVEYLFIVCLVFLERLVS